MGVESRGIFNKAKRYAVEQQHQAPCIKTAGFIKTARKVKPRGRNAVPGSAMQCSTEAFSTTLRICGIFTILLTCPLLVYHLWGFLIPSRYLFERKRFFFLLSLLIFCFCIEIDFLYFLIFPKLCEYLTSFGVNSGEIHNLVAFTVDFSPRMESYITLLLRVCIIFLFISQFPLICIVAYFKKWITCYDLCQIRKPLFFSSLLITAAISPPDIISQFIFLLLFFIVNEVLIIFGFIYDAKNCIIEEYT